MDEHVEAVQRMQDYIATHLDINITMADLAKVSQYSPWYSYRLFMDLLHMTPAVYIRRLRLSKSALRLRDEKVKIIDIAFDAGFDSVDGYQRAFYKEFGCNPYEIFRMSYTNLSVQALWNQICSKKGEGKNERSEKCFLASSGET